MTTTIPEKWLTAADLAERWGVSKQKVYAIPLKELRCHKLGRLRRYRPEDVRAYEDGTRCQVISITEARA